MKRLLAILVMLAGSLGLVGINPSVAEAQTSYPCSQSNYIASNSGSGHRYRCIQSGNHVIVNRYDIGLNYIGTVLDTWIPSWITVYMANDTVPGYGVTANMCGNPDAHLSTFGAPPGWSFRYVRSSPFQYDGVVNTASDPWIFVDYDDALVCAGSMAQLY